MSDSPFLQKAQEALKAARVLMEEGCLNSASNRSYYAAFHAARAALVQARECTNETPWSHKALQSAFSKLVNKKKIYPSELRAHLSALIATREIADYETEMVSLRMAKDAFRKAEAFVAAIQKGASK